MMSPFCPVPYCPILNNGQIAEEYVFKWKTGPLKERKTS